MTKAQLEHYKYLYQQHVNALHRQGKSKSTIDVYARAVRRITEFFDCCPDTLCKEDLKEHFSHLVQSHSWSTVKVDRNGLQFFYKHVLNKEWQWIEIVKPPQVRTLPDILTPDEVSLILNATREARYKTYILIVYCMGLRLGEGLNLKVGDIDGRRMKIHVRAGKGRKDRFVTMPQTALYALRKYWCTHRHPSLLFPAGKTPEEQHRAQVPMDRGGLQKSFKAIVKSCNIHKNITIHSLRHCYGTHLVEVGLNLRAIQKELGHECPKTTALYTQLTEPVQQNASDLINAMVNRLSIVQNEED
jgi:integrase/recombinase XerD